MTNADRCCWAIHFGVVLHTRCQWDRGHDGSHMGFGLPQFPHQSVKWFPGDRREYQTERTDHFAWEERP